MSKDLTTIVERSARMLEVNCDTDGAREIAVRSRGTPGLRIDYFAESGTMRRWRVRDS